MPEEKSIRVATQVLDVSALILCKVQVWRIVIILSFQRLRLFPIKEKLSEDDPEISNEPLMFVGALYGIDIEDISEEAVIVSVTGRPIPLKDKEGEKSHRKIFQIKISPFFFN
jgi:hypothetical protein